MSANTVRSFTQTPISFKSR